VDEGDLEINSDLDDEEGEIAQEGHRGETRDGCRACLALDEALLRLHGAQLCMSGKGHLTAADLLRDLGQLDGACAAVRRAAIIQLTATAAAIAAYGSADAPVAAPGEDRLLDAKEMAARLGLPESFVRTKERLGLIPSVRAGRYVRFKPDEVALALRKRA